MLIKIKIPVANSFKFTEAGSADDERANFDQRRYAEVENATMEKRQYLQLAEKADIHPLEVYTNLPYVLIEVIDCDDNVLQTYIPTILVEYRNKKFRSSCRFAALDGKLFVYFLAEVGYTDEDFLITGDTTSYDGSTPMINAQIGDLVRYQIGSDPMLASTITAIEWNPAVQAEGYVLDVDSAIITPVTGLIEVSYNQKDVDLWSTIISMNDFVFNNAIIFIRMKFALVSTNILKTFISEPIHLKTKHKESLLLRYKHVGDLSDALHWNFDYSIGFNNIRFPSNFYQVAVAGELEIDQNDTGVNRILRSVPFRQILFRIFNIPGWILDKLLVIFSHDTKEINGYEWEIDNYGSAENIDRVDLTTLEINLRQKGDRTLFSVEAEEEITAFFTPDNDTAIAAGEVLGFLFSSNTSGVFSFVKLPDWLHTDVSTFEDGDTVNITVDANVPAFDRNITLLATSPSFGSELIASIEITQAHDVPVGEFIEVDINPVLLDGASGSDELLNVNSSGDYDITVTGFAFTTAKESGFTQFRITAPSDNLTITNRTATIRLALQSNPTVFVDIDVEQVTALKMYGLTPNSTITPSSGGPCEDINVNCASDCQWQMVTTAPWIIVDSTIFTGPQVVGVSEIFFNGRDEFIPAPRFGTVTFYNILNPSDSKTLTVQQN